MSFRGNKGSESQVQILLEASLWNRSFKILILGICVAKADTRDLHINLEHLFMNEMLVLFETILIGNAF